MNMLDIRNLDKSFGALHVSRDISLAIAEDECHALIGPNGAGKTTLMHQLSGKLAPDSGQIFLDGRDLSGLTMASRVQAGLGRTFQITSILRSFSALENTAIAVQAKSGSSMRFIAQAAREKELNEAARDVLGQVGLGKRADALAANLSHGELRLLELAIALAGKPKFLLLDEPMAGLGHRESIALIDFLGELRGKIPMLLVEHDMDAIFKLADVVSVLVEGEVVARGTPDEVRTDTRARAAYLGEDAA